MDKIIEQRRSGEGALAWIAFIAIAMVFTAALITAGVRHAVGRDKTSSDAAPALTHPAPAPAPAPLPKPGVSPTGATLKQNA